MMQGLSKTRVAQALAQLSAPLTSGQYWVLLPLAVSEGLGLLLEAGALKKRREIIAGLPSSIAAAFPENLSLSAELKTSLQNRAASLVQLVSREIEGLDVVERPGAEIAREVLASAPESISGRIADLMTPSSTLSPNRLAAALREELVRLLKPVLGDEAESIAENLAGAIVVSLAEDPVPKNAF